MGKTAGGKALTTKHQQRVSTSHGPATPTGSEAVALGNINPAAGDIISPVMKPQVLTELLSARLSACHLLLSLQPHRLVKQREGR